MTPLEQLVLGPSFAAVEALQRVPDEPGYYAIFVDSPIALGEVYSMHIPASGLIYIGMASRSLQSRLARQDLRHDAPASFFRSLGAALQFMPPKGSLAGKTNRTNYRFSSTGTREIIDWIDQHLSISWLSEPPLKCEEKRLIQLHKPLLNIRHNPEKCPQLVELRRLCIERACVAV